MQIFDDFCGFWPFPRKCSKRLGNADFRRKPRVFAGNRRKPQEPAQKLQTAVCPLRFVPLSATLVNSLFSLFRNRIPPVSELRHDKHKQCRKRSWRSSMCTPLQILPRTVSACFLTVLQVCAAQRRLGRSFGLFFFCLFSSVSGAGT